STYLLQTLGFAAIAEGNIIRMEQTSAEVAQACSGLGMLMTFFALAAAVSMMTRRSVVQKGVVVLIAIPIAMVANVLRVAGAAILAETVGLEFADWVSHRSHLAEVFMMTAALGLLGLELCLMSKLWLESRQSEETSFGIVGFEPRNIGRAAAQPAQQAS